MGRRIKSMRMRLGRAIAGVRSRRYDAGKVTRLLSASSSRGPADDDIRMDLTEATANARGLTQNDPYAAKFMRLVAQNVVRPGGSVLQCMSIEPDGKLDAVANRVIEARYKDFSRRGNFTVCGRYSRYQCEKIWAKSLARDGAYIARKLLGKQHGDHAFAIQMLSIDVLDVALNDVSPNGNKIKMGIESNDWGRPVAYWLLTDDNGATSLPSSSKKYKRIPATEIIHVFDPDRAEQTRGFPAMASVQKTVQMFKGYREAEVTAARQGASSVGFFTTEGDSPMGDSDTGDEGEIVFDLSEGPQFRELPVGMKLENWDSKHPSTAFEAFSKQMLHGHAAGYGVSYAALSTDLAGTSFASGRRGDLEDRDRWQNEQALHRETLTDIYEDWLLVQLGSGLINLPFSKREKFRAHTWQMKGFAWIDPVKEADANLVQVENGWKTNTDVSAEQGRDRSDVLAQLKREQDEEERLGVELGSREARDARDEDDDED